MTATPHPQNGPQQPGPQQPSSQQPSPQQPGPHQPVPVGPGQTPPSGGGRRGVVIALIVVVVGALLLVMLGIGTVWLLMRGSAPEAAPTSAPPTYVAPTPMTEVDTDWYTFSYPEAWQHQDDVERGSMNFALSVMDAAENSKMIIMDYRPTSGDTWEDACEKARKEQGGYAPMPDVVVGGRTALHFQFVDTEPDTGRSRVQDMWCMPSSGSLVMVLGRTAGPEAESAGISEIQKVLDTWEWKDEG